MIGGENRSLKVFLCHASSDKPVVQKLYSRLVNDGIDAWLDKEKLLPGQNWQIEIPKAVRNSDIVIVCLSSQSVNKEGFVQKEIKIALDAADEKPEGTIFIIPARLENCNVPERLSQFHWVDLFSKNGYEWLLKALQARANTVGATFDFSQQESISHRDNGNEKKVLEYRQRANDIQSKNKENEKKESKNQKLVSKNENSIELITKQIEELENLKDSLGKPIPISSLIIVGGFWFIMLGIVSSTFNSGGLIFIAGLIVTISTAVIMFDRQKQKTKKSLEDVTKKIQQLKVKLRLLKQ